MSDPALDAFVTSNGDLRIRGAFRLLGVLLTAVLVLPLTVDTLEVFHEGIYLIYPGPFAACWLLGELAVLLRRVLRPRVPHIPVARVVRRPATRLALR